MCRFVRQAGGVGERVIDRHVGRRVRPLTGNRTRCRRPARPRLARAFALRLAGVLCSWRVLCEDTLLVLAVHEALELLLVDCLVLDQDRCDLVQGCVVWSSTSFAAR